MDIGHKATRSAIGVAIDMAIKHTKKDKEEGVKDIIKLFSQFMKPTKEDLQEGTGGNAFSGMNHIINESNKKWVTYISNLFNEIDPKIIKTLTLSLAYESGYRGMNEIRKARKENNCNIPWAIIFDPTSACNRHCKGCWSGEYGDKSSLSYEDMESIVSQANAFGTHFFLMTGGEPLVRKADIITLAKNHPDSEFHIFTNGTLIDQKFCDDLLSVGNIILALSLEGWEDTNDFRRGKGSFQYTMDAMDLLKKNKLAFGTSICWTHQNYKTVVSDEFVDMIIQKGCRWAWYFHFMPVGQNTNTDLLPTAEDRVDFLSRIRKIRSSESDKQIVPLDFQNDSEFVGGCIAGGKNYLHINSAGDVEPCVFIHYSSANIHDMSLLDCLKQPLFQAYHREQPFNKDLYMPCPMLENPEFLPRMVRESGAHSTDLEAPETAEHLCAKTKEYARQWKPLSHELWEKTPEKSKLRAEKALHKKEMFQKIVPVEETKAN